MVPLSLTEFHGYQLVAPPREAPGGLLMLGARPEQGDSVLIKLTRLPSTPDRDRRIDAFLSDVARVRTLGDRDHLPILEAGVDGEHAYVVHPGPAGPDLKPFLRRSERLPIPCILQGMARLAWVVQRAHDAGILHLSLAPDNVYLHPARTQVSDFGFHHLLAQGPQIFEVSHGPRGALDPRSDVYAVGLLIYHLSTGVHPLARRNGGRGGRRGYIAPPHWWDPGLPAGLEEICERALAEEPGDRYPTARALARALEELPELLSVGEAGVTWPDLSSGLSPERGSALERMSSLNRTEVVVAGGRDEDPGHQPPGAAPEVDLSEVSTGVIPRRRLNLALELSHSPEPAAATSAVPRSEEDAGNVSWRALKSFPVPIGDGAIVLDLHLADGQPRPAPTAEDAQLARILPWRPRATDAIAEDEAEDTDEAEGDDTAQDLPDQAVADLAPPVERPAPRREAPGPLVVGLPRGLRPRPLRIVPPPVGDWALDGPSEPAPASALDRAVDYGAAAWDEPRPAPVAPPRAQPGIAATVLATLLVVVPLQYAVSRALNSQDAAPVAAAPLAPVEHQSALQLEAAVASDAADSLVPYGPPRPPVAASIASAPLDMTVSVNAPDAAPVSVAALPTANRAQTPPRKTPTLAHEAARHSAKGLRGADAPAQAAPRPSERAVTKTGAPSSAASVAGGTAPALATTFSPPGRGVEEAPARPAVIPARGADPMLTAMADAPAAPVPTDPRTPKVAPAPQALGAPVEREKKVAPPVVVAAASAPAPEAPAAPPTASAAISLSHTPPDLGHEHPMMVLRASGADGMLVTLWWRTEPGPFTRTSMSPTGDGRYAARLPAAAGREVEYFFETLDENGARTTLREDAPYRLVLPEAPAADSRSRRKN